MREAIGGTSLFGIVILFVFLFAAYISLSINFSKAYNVKNEIINIIKNQGGICTSDSANICNNFKVQIRDYFLDANYRSSGNCESGWVGFAKDGEFLGEGANNAAFCVRAIKANDASELPNALYYKVKVFYRLGLPIVEVLFDFSITGETSRIYSPNECDTSLDNATYPVPWC